MANPVSRSSQLVFVLLQLADVVTTLLAFALGGGETNALVARLMIMGGTIPGLILAKIIVLSVAVVVVWLRKGRALRWANVVYTGIVAWNLTIIARLAIRNLSW
jgi:hypothetical protein